MLGGFPVHVPELHLKERHVGVRVVPDANLESLVLASDMVGKAAIILGVEIKVVVAGRATIVDA